MRELLITTDNYHKYASAEQYTLLWDEALKAMMDVNNVLDEELGNHNDWGGQYHAWLTSLGIPPETDDGWWTKAAIDPENIQAFIDYETDEEEDGWFDKCQDARGKIKQIAKFGTFISNFRKAREIVESMNQL